MLLIYLYKNTDILKLRLVISKLNMRKVNLVPTEMVKRKSEAEVTEPCELVIGCPAGFGFKKPERVCCKLYIFPVILNILLAYEFLLLSNYYK